MNESKSDLKMVSVLVTFEAPNGHQGDLVVWVSENQRGELLEILESLDFEYIAPNVSQKDFPGGFVRIEV